MTGRLTIPKESTFDPNNRELNEKLMRFQEGIRNAHQGAQLAATRRLAPQVAVTESGFLARAGMFLPVSAATTILLAKPTPDTAGQPLAIYNSSGGVVVLDPVDSTINGRDVGWIDEGLHILYPDASGWFGGFSAEIGITLGTIAGVTTGALQLGGITDADSGLSRRLLLGLFGIQAASFAQVPVVSTSPNMLGLQNVNNNTTVAARIVHAFDNMLPPWISGALTINHPDEANDLLGISVLLKNADQDTRIRRNTSTSTGTTSSVSVTTTLPGALVIDVLANDDATDTGTAGDGQTVIANGSADSATISLQASYKSMPRPGTTTMSWSGLTNAANKAHIAIVIEPARAA